MTKRQTTRTAANRNDHQSKRGKVEVSTSALEEAMALLTSGYTLQEIARIQGTPLSTLQSRLVRVYGRGYRSVVPVPPLTEADLVEARAMVLRGAKLREVGARYGRSEKAISAALIRRWGRGYRNSLVRSLRADLSPTPTTTQRVSDAPFKDVLSGASPSLRKRHLDEVEAWLSRVTEDAARGLLDDYETEKYVSNYQQRGRSRYETGRNADIREVATIYGTAL